MSEYTTYTLIFQEERQHLVYLESELCRAGEARPDEAAEDAEEAEEAGE